MDLFQRFVCFPSPRIFFLPFYPPQPLEQLATKKEFYMWLAQLLLITLRNSNSDLPPRRVDLLNNLTAFHIFVHYSY